jgi:hypothetical protein
MEICAQLTYDTLQFTKAPHVPHTTTTVRIDEFSAIIVNLPLPYARQ